MPLARGPEPFRMKPVLSFRKVDLRRGNTLVLSGLDLEVYEGETVVLLGRSGSGKTSALKLINALLERTAGELDVFDKPIGEWNPIELRRRIGYVIQEVGLLPHFTVEQNIGLVPYLTGWPPDRTRDRVRELMLLVGLDPGEFASRFPSQLSGGQRQRVGITRALAASPSLLLLDEPFGALDPVTRLDLQREFLRLREV